MNELQQLLCLVRHVLFGEALPQEMDWKRMRSLAFYHHLEGFLYYAMRGRNDVDESIKAECKKKQMVFVAQQLGQDAAAKAIYEALAKAGIRYMPLKAIWFRPLYPTPDLRFSCDIDFYFDSSHAKGVHSLLVAQGFVKEREDVHNYVYTKGILTVEPHFAIADGDKEAAYFGDVWTRATTQDGTLYTFSDEDCYIYHLLHTYKHMLHGGAGVRSVIDTWLWNKNKPQMNQAYLEAEYEKLGIAKFAKAIERLSRVWFDGEAGDEDMTCLETFVLQGGVYGTETQWAHMGYVEGNDPASLRRAKRRYLWKRMFPTYRDLCISYPVVKKWPILVPFVWVHRIIKALFTSKKKRIGDSIGVAQSIDQKGATLVSRVKTIIGA